MNSSEASIIPIKDKASKDIKKKMKNFFNFCTKFTYCEREYFFVYDQIDPDALNKVSNIIYPQSNHVRVEIPNSVSDCIAVDARFPDLESIALTFTSAINFDKHVLYTLVKSKATMVEQNSLPLKCFFAFLKQINVICSPSFGEFPLFGISPIPKDINTDVFLLMAQKYFPEITFQNIDIVDGVAYCLMKDQIEVSDAIKFFNNSKISGSTVNAEKVKNSPKASKASKKTDSKAPKKQEGILFNPPKNKKEITSPTSKKQEDILFKPPKNKKEITSPTSKKQEGIFFKPPNTEEEITSPTSKKQEDVLFKPPKNKKEIKSPTSKKQEGIPPNTEAEIKSPTSRKTTTTVSESDNGNSVFVNCNDTEKDTYLLSDIIECAMRKNEPRFG